MEHEENQGCEPVEKIITDSSGNELIALSEDESRFYQEQVSQQED